MTDTIPVQVYTDDCGEWTAVPHVTRERAIEMYAEFTGRDPAEVVATEILLRPATEVERRIYGWDEGAVTECSARAAKAVPGWRLE